MRTFLQPFYVAFVALTFLLSLIILFPFIIILGTKDSAKRRKIITAIVQHWSVGWLWLIGMRLRKTGAFPKGQKFVVIANHISYLDTINIYAAVPEYFRTLARKEMAAIPVFGFVYKQVAILVDRSSPESRSKSMRLMWRQLRNECHIALFPEGSFNETGAVMKDFYDGAFRLAIASQMPLLPLLFPDTERRWHYSKWYRLWPGRNRVIYLEPVPVAGLEMKDLPALKERVKEMMEKRLLIS